MTTVATARPLRADAARNRERLLEVALQAFTASEAEVPLETIAAEAGLGVGTLYRHFPNRSALVEAVYRHEVGRLCDSANRLLTRHPADEALRRWMGDFVEYAATKRGMAQALSQAVAERQSSLADSRTQIRSALSRLIDAAAREGSIRSDLSPEDVMRAMGGIWQMADGPQWREHARRLLGLLMDGLRYGAPGPSS